MRTTLILAALLTVAHAQTYVGTVGTVVAYPAEIKLNTWSRKFVGWYEITPGNKVRMTGKAVGGVFKIDGWFSTKAKITNQSIIGSGVWLVRR